MAAADSPSLSSSTTVPTPHELAIPQFGKSTTTAVAAAAAANVVPVGPLAGGETTTNAQQVIGTGQGGDGGNVIGKPEANDASAPVSQAATKIFGIDPHQPPPPLPPPPPTATTDPPIMLPNQSIGITGTVANKLAPPLPTQQTQPQPTPHPPISAEVSTAATTNNNIINSGQGNQQNRTTHVTTNNQQPIVPPLIIPVPQPSAPKTTAKPKVSGAKASSRSKKSTTTTQQENSNSSTATTPASVAASTSPTKPQPTTPSKPKPSRAKKATTTQTANATPESNSTSENVPKPVETKSSKSSKAAANKAAAAAAAATNSTVTYEGSVTQTPAGKGQANNNNINSSPVPSKRKARSATSELTVTTALNSSSNNNNSNNVSPSPAKRQRKKKSDTTTTTNTTTIAQQANKTTTGQQNVPGGGIGGSGSSNSANFHPNQQLLTSSMPPIGPSGPLMINTPPASIVNNRLMPGSGINSMEGQDMHNRYFLPVVSPYASYDQMSSTSLSRSSLSRLFTSSSVDNNLVGSPPDDLAKAFDELRDNTWSHLSKSILDQAQQFDIPSLIGTLHTLRMENERLVNKVRDLTMKRDQLVAIQARLELPGPALTQHLNNTSPNFSSVVSVLNNSSKSLPASSPSSAMNKQPLISTGTYNHVPPGALGLPSHLDRSSPLVNQTHSGMNNIKSSAISTPSPPIGALMAHSTNNRAGLTTVNPPYLSNVYPPMNTMPSLGTSPKGSSYYPRQ